MTQETATTEIPSPTAALPRSREAIGVAERMALVVGIVCLLGLAFRVFAFVQDDAFITYRYAWHVRHGFGPVFNPGERTEGYSCPLYMALTTLLMWLPGDVLFRAKALGIVFAAAAIVAAWRLAHEMELPVWARIATPVMLGTNPSLALSAVDGMETSFQMLLVTLAALLFVRERKTGRGWASGVALLAVVLNRGEGFLYLLAALPLLGLDIRRRGIGKRDAIWLAVTVIPTTLFFLWRHAYYGWWMPNTYYAKKMPIAEALDLRNGPPYAVRTIFYNLDGRVALVAASLVLWLAALAGAQSERIRRQRALVIPAFVVVQLAVALRAGGDWMQGWRYMMAVVPLWTLLIVTGFAEPGEALANPSRSGTGRALGLCGVAVFLGACVWASIEYDRPKEGQVSWAARGWATDARGLLRDYRMENTLITADILNERLPAGASVAFSEVGAVPYYTPKLRWLDTYGLTDSGIAHLPSMNRFRTGMTGDYTSADTIIGKELLRRKPDYIIRWIPADSPESSILDGAYAPFFRAPVKPLFGTPGSTVLQVWKRAG
jgi:arabinofuranosyltransferase